MDYDFTLIRSRKRKKTISLAVNREGSVVVRAPYGVPRTEIEGFVSRKRAWLVRKLKEFKAGSGDASEAPLLAGDGILYLGNVYPLSVNLCALPGKQALLWDGSAFHLSCREPAAGKNLLTRWYVRQANAFFPGRMAQHAERMGVSPKNLRISSARFRWGSCSTRQCISLSWRLMMAPVAVIDSVMIHELAHLRELNHSSRFWTFVRTYCPEYDRHKRWLNREGRYLMEF